MQVVTLQSSEWAEAEKNGLTEDKVTDFIMQGYNETRHLLPMLSEQLNIAVRPHFIGIIPEYGTGAYTHDSDLIIIAFDKNVPHGVEKTLESLRLTVLHEANHAARYNVTEFDGSFLNYVITEGLATAFEREYGHYSPLYGRYEDEATMKAWLKELQKGGWDKKDDLFFRHPDGRRWIGYKTGTWLIDKALKHSDKTIIEMTSMKCKDILALTGLEI